MKPVKTEIVEILLICFKFLKYLLRSFWSSLISDVSVEEKDATNLIQNGLCKLDSKSSVTMTSKGLELMK